MLVIDLPSQSVAGAFSQRTRLGERDYILTYRRNSRVDTFTLDIDALQEGGDPLPVLTGKKLFIGHDLIRNCFETEKPAGSIILMRFDGTRDAPGQSDLSRCKLVYLEEGDAQLGAG